LLCDIDEASLRVAVRFEACAVQVLGRSLAKVTRFGPCEQFLPGAMLGASTHYVRTPPAGWSAYPCFAVRLGGVSGGRKTHG
jgi:hypothetical protein